MIENVRLAIGGIWSHKMRSILTMLGIIIGIAAIISIVSTIKGTNEQIKKNLIGAGNDTVKVSLTAGGYDYTISDYSSVPKGIPQISEETVGKILELSEVESVTVYNSRYISEGMFYKKQSLSDLYVYGIDKSYFDTCNYIIRTGRNFLDDDFSKHRKVMIMDQKAALNLFSDEDPIGKTVEISAQPFTVIGIVEDRSRYEIEIESIDDYYTYQDDTNGLVYIPGSAWPIIYNFDEPQNVIVKAVSTDDMTQAGRKTASILNSTISDSATDEFGQNVKYGAQDLLSQAASIQRLRNATNMQLIWIAGISLLVGGIGVMNIMLVSVTERTAEIGLKKAIGARKSTILWQFLTEAAVLTSLGGIMGVGAGIGAAYVIHRVSGVAVAIDIPASVIAVVFSMGIGILFGFLPSVQAANLDPIEALRRE